MLDFFATDFSLISCEMEFLQRDLKHAIPASNGKEKMYTKIESDIVIYFFLFQNATKHIL